MQETVILNMIDLPPRVLLWPVSEVILVCGPSLMMIIFGQVVLSLFWAVGAVLSVKYFKRYFGSGYLNAVMYWYLPTSKEQFLVSPPSYQRNFIN